jgi:hypothetical protein
MMSFGNSLGMDRKENTFAQQQVKETDRQRDKQTNKHSILEDSRRQHLSPFCSYVEALS